MDSKSFEQLFDTLQAEIFRDSGDALPRYVLIDPAWRDPLSGDTELAARLHDASRLVIRVNGWPVDKNPYLIALAGLTSQDCAALLRLELEETLGNHDEERGQPRTVCAWLSPWQDDIKQLAVRMAERAIAHPPTGSSTVVFRYWDPRQAAHLPRILGEAAWHEHLCLLGLQRWTSLVATNDGAARATLAESSRETPSQERARHWRFDLRQWRGIETLSWANRLIQCCADWNRAAPLSSLENIASRALSHGLTEENDILRFAHCVLTIHPQFDSHPQVAAALSASQSGQAGFGETVSNWPETYIDELKSGSWLIPPASPTRKAIQQ